MRPDERNLTGTCTTNSLLNDAATPTIRGHRPCRRGAQRTSCCDVDSDRPTTSVPSTSVRSTILCLCRSSFDGVDEMGSRLSSWRPSLRSRKRAATSRPVASRRDHSRDCAGRMPSGRRLMPPLGDSTAGGRRSETSQAQAKEGERVDRR